jgi:hypothetical protein
MISNKHDDAVDNNKDPSDKKPRLVYPTDRLGTTGRAMDIFYHVLEYGRLPQVSMDDIEIINVVGSGRNGCCFRVKWNGQELAMKQFDIGRDGDKYYAKEVTAYMLLRDVWGILVPRPVFVSESASGGRLFLGLQLGREPNDEDDTSKFHDVLDRLTKEYCIQHNDPDESNMIVITDPNNGAERIVAIDFEDWDFV